MMFGSFGSERQIEGFCDSVFASQVVPALGAPIKKA